MRNDNYWRIELPYDNTTHENLAIDLKRILPLVLQYEATACPFERAFHVELPASSPTIKRPWRPRQQPTASVMQRPSASSGDTSPTHEGPGRRSYSRDTGIAPTDSHPVLDGTPDGAMDDKGHVLHYPEDSAATVEQHVSAYERLSATERSLDTPRQISLEPSLSDNSMQAHGWPDGHSDGNQGEALGQIMCSSHAETQTSSQASAMTTESPSRGSFSRVHSAGTLKKNDGPVQSGEAACNDDHDAPPGAESEISRRRIGAEHQSVRLPDYLSDSSTPTQTITSEIRHGNGSLRSDAQHRLMQPAALPSRIDPPSTDGGKSPEAETGSISSSIDSFYSLKSSSSASSRGGAASHVPGSPSPESKNGLPLHMSMRSSQQSAPCSLLEDSPAVSDEVLPAHRDSNFCHQSCQKTAKTSVGLEDEMAPNARLIRGNHSPSAPSAALRQRFKSRRLHSPPPEPANLHLPSTRTTGSYLTSHILQKTCSLLLGPPVQIVALMLNLAARLANGALAAGPFTYDASGQPIPCSWSFREDEAADDEWDDDFFSLNGPRGTNVTRSTSWEVD